MNKTQERIEQVEKGALAKGKKELLAHLYGEQAKESEEKK